MATADSHSVHAFDIATGKLRWTAATGLTGPGAFSETGCLAAKDVISCGDGPDIVGLARLDGHVVWRYHPSVGSDVGVNPGIIDSTGSVIFAPTETGTIHAIDGATGQSRWVAQALPTTASLYKVARANGVVFGAFTNFARIDTGGVIALSEIDGSTLWIAQLPPVAPETFDGAKDVVTWGSYAIVSLQGGRIVALDQSTGQVEWTLPSVGHYAGWIGVTTPVVGDIRALVVVGSTLLAASESGWIVAYDLPSHTELWRASAPHANGTIWQIEADQNAVVVTSTTQLVFGFSTTKPQLLWEVGPSVFFTEPVLGPDRFFVGATNGYYAIRR